MSEPTSLEAYRAIADALPAMRRKSYLAVCQHPHSTAGELDEYLPAEERGQLHKRLAELVRSGHILVGATRLSTHGRGNRNAKTYYPNPNPPKENP